MQNDKVDAQDLVPHFDESKEIEVIYDFHGAQIIRVNSVNTNLFLEIGKTFDNECLKRIDQNGVIKIIYIVDKVPPLSAILRFMEDPFDAVKWGVYAIIAPENSALINKIAPIVTYGLNITNMKDKYTVKIFENKERNNLIEVFKWMNANSAPKNKSEVETL